MINNRFTLPAAQAGRAATATAQEKTQRSEESREEKKA